MSSRTQRIMQMCADNNEIPHDAVCDLNMNGVTVHPNLDLTANLTDFEEDPGEIIGDLLHRTTSLHTSRPSVSVQLISNLPTNERNLEMVSPVPELDTRVYEEKLPNPNSFLEARNKRKCSNSLVDYDSSSSAVYDSDADPEYKVPEILTDSEPDELARKSTDVKSRWAKAKIDTWKSTEVKKLRSECKPYTTKTGLKSAKAPKPVNCGNCRFKCTRHFSQEDRLLICKSYWELDFKRQKDFIIKFVKTETPKRRKVEAKKQRVMSKQYYLKNVDGTYRVCAKFFENTLCISNGPINTAVAHVNEYGTFSGNDNRGHKVPGNKTSEESIQLVKQHIESFPRMLPHYIRKSSKRQYLEPRLSILKMYSLYLDFCMQKSVSPVRNNVYRNIFCTQYNLSFFVPKKDQCNICAKFTSIKNDDALKQVYEQHIARKDDCNREKDKDKKRANEDDAFQTITFDLQSVLQLPSSDIGQLYYSRKLCVYNFTIYEGGKENKGFCYFWNEVHGKRGSTEIGSLLLKYIESLPGTITHLTMFSDTCGGQNRNQYVAAALLHCVDSHPTIQIIEHKFLESGHSYMECDSMHSAIENAQKNRSIFLMNDWREIFKSARSRNKTKKAPYEVIELKFGDFMDLQKLANQIIKNRSVDDEGNKVEWLKIKCLRYEKGNPGVIFFKYNHTSDFKKLNVKGRGRRRQEPHTLTPAYTRQLPISDKKKKDLIKLCQSGIIPEEVQAWYRNLPSTSNESEEQLSESAEGESDGEED